MLGLESMNSIISAEKNPGLFFADSLDSQGEIFLIPYLDGHLFYVPRLGIVALIQRSLAELLRRDSFKEYGSETLLALAEHLAFPSGWQELLAQTRSDQPSGWRPTHVTFSTTQKCTLRCRYCYADGGRLDDIDIDIPMAEAAVDFVVSNATLANERAELTFIGEGEATANFEGFSHIISYFRQRCEANQVKSYVSLTTNGVFSKTRVDYIARNCDSIVVSLDGTEKAHNSNRVLPTGNGSFDRVVETLRALDARGKPYTIRTTATVDATEDLTDFLTWIGRNTLCKFVHIEPVANMSGVAKTAESTDHPMTGTFVDSFRRARTIAAAFSIELHYSSADAKFRTKFCGASDAYNFMVTSRGLVSSCIEVLRPDDPRSKLFHYGRWDKASSKFVFDERAISKLRRLNVGEIPKCNGCFAKYNCAGDCYAKSAIPNGDPWGPEYTSRCDVTRELLKDNLAVGLLRSTAAASSAGSR